MINKLLQKIRFKKEELKDNKDWISLLDIFNRNPQLLLDFVFDEENGGMGITNDIIEDINEIKHLHYSKKWSFIVSQKKFKIEKEIEMKSSFLKSYKKTIDRTENEKKVINKKIQELEIELNELQKINKKLTKN
jgi:hypothetical protein